MTRTAKVSRKTSETDIEIELNIDGTGKLWHWHWSQFLQSYVGIIF